MNIVITGGSKGIGFNTALHLAKGNKVFVLSRDEKGLKNLLDASGNNEGIRIMSCDISDEKSVYETVNSINKEVNGIEVLINNAGLLINKSFSLLTFADWWTIYNVNVFGVVNITRALLPLLKKGSIYTEGEIKAHIVNISSVGGLQGSQKYNGLSAYSSSKGALITLSECLAEEFKSLGIYVNCIALGSVNTEMFHTAFPGMKASSMPEDVGSWIGDFAMKGFHFFNGKIIPLSTGNP